MTLPRAPPPFQAKGQLRASEGELEAARGVGANLGALVGGLAAKVEQSEAQLLAAKEELRETRALLERTADDKAALAGELANARRRADRAEQVISPFFFF